MLSYNTEDLLWDSDRAWNYALKKTDYNINYIKTKDEA